MHLLYCNGATPPLPWRGTYVLVVLLLSCCFSSLKNVAPRLILLRYFRKCATRRRSNGESDYMCCCDFGECAFKVDSVWLTVDSRLSLCVSVCLSACLLFCLALVMLICWIGSMRAFGYIFMTVCVCGGGRTVHLFTKHIRCTRANSSMLPDSSSFVAPKLFHSSLVWASERYLEPFHCCWWVSMWLVSSMLGN